MLALENQITVLVMHRRFQGHDTGGALGFKVGDRQHRVDSITRIHVLQESG